MFIVLSEINACGLFWEKKSIGDVVAKKKSS
jgi:hypothetical protein